MCVKITYGVIISSKNLDHVYFSLYVGKGDDRRLSGKLILEHDDFQDFISKLDAQVRQITVPKVTVDELAGC
jgi:hypothetical protein